MLQGLLAITGGDVEEAAAIYNSGQPGEAGTTHADYGIDVRQRMQFLQQTFAGDSDAQPGTPAWFHRDLSLTYTATRPRYKQSGRTSPGAVTGSPRCGFSTC